MYVFETKIRVRYAETDQMSYVYYGIYAQYLEVGRVEALRNIGIVYKDLELEGIMMPVLEMNIKYFRPARYDDLLTVRTSIKKMPSQKVSFDFEIFNQKDVLLTKAYTTLVFVNMETGKPVMLPGMVADKLSAFFN